MRFFLTLTTLTFITVFSATTNAASIMMNKRAAQNVELCVKSINDISTQIGVLQPTIQNGGIIDTSREYGDLEDNIRSAQASCCAINSPISDADADYFLNSYGSATPKIQGLMSSLTQKADDYNFITRGVIQLRLESLNKLADNLNVCLVVFTPASKASVLQGDIDKINTAFSSTRAAYHFL